MVYHKNYFNIDMVMTIIISLPATKENRLLFLIYYNTHW